MGKTLLGSIGLMSNLTGMISGAGDVCMLAVCCYPRLPTYERKIDMLHCPLEEIVQLILSAAMNFFYD